VFGHRKITIVPSDPKQSNVILDHPFEGVCVQIDKIILKVNENTKEFKTKISYTTDIEITDELNECVGNVVTELLKRDDTQFKMS